MKNKTDFIEIAAGVFIALVAAHLIIDRTTIPEGTMDCRGAENVTFQNGLTHEIVIPRYSITFLDDANNNRLTYILENGCTVVVKEGEQDARNNNR